MGKGFNMRDMFNDQSLTQEDGGAYEIRLIPLEKLLPSKINHYSIEDIEELADSILNVGLMHNLYVKKEDEQGMYEIISGERRFHALMLNVERGHDQFTVAPCHVDGCEDPFLQELKLLDANALARVLKPADIAYQAKRRAEIYQELKDRGVPVRGKVRELVAKDMGVSPAQVSRYESINNNLTKEVKDEFNAGRIGVTDAYDISTLPMDEQSAVLAEYRETGELKNPKKVARKEKQATKADHVDMTDVSAASIILMAGDTIEGQAAPVADQAEQVDEFHNVALVAGEEPEKLYVEGVEKRLNEAHGDCAGPDDEYLPVQTSAEDAEGGKIVICPCCLRKFILTS